MCAFPKVSIIVPSFNKTQYLRECLRSIQEQTFLDWECIVVADGAPDIEAVRAAVKSLNDSRIRLVRHTKNRGLSAARNTGILQSRSDLLLFVDEDDKLANTALSKLTSLMLEKAPSIVLCNAARLDEPSIVYPAEVPVLETALLKLPAQLPGCLLRKEVFHEVGLFDEHPVIRYGREDFEWWIRVALADVPVAICPEPLYHIRRVRGEIGLRSSLNFVATKNEISITKYILEKHSELYRRRRRARRILVAKAFHAMATYWRTERNSVKSLYYEWRSAIVWMSASGFKRALKTTFEIASEVLSR